MTSFLGLRDGRFVSYLDQAKPQRHHSILTYAFSIQATNLALAQELLQTIHNKDSCFSPYSAVRRSLESPLPHPLRVVDQQPPLSSDGSCHCFSPHEAMPKGLGGFKPTNTLNSAPLGSQKFQNAPTKRGLSDGFVSIDHGSRELGLKAVARTSSGASPIHPPRRTVEDDRDELAGSSPPASAHDSSARKQNDTQTDASSMSLESYYITLRGYSCHGIDRAPAKEPVFLSWHPTDPMRLKVRERHASGLLSHIGLDDICNAYSSANMGGLCAHLDERPREQLEGRSKGHFFKFRNRKDLYCFDEIVRANCTRVVPQTKSEHWIKTVVDTKQQEAEASESTHAWKEAGDVRAGNEELAELALRPQQRSHEEPVTVDERLMEEREPSLQSAHSAQPPAAEEPKGIVNPMQQTMQHKSQERPPRASQRSTRSNRAGQAKASSASSWTLSYPPNKPNRQTVEKSELQYLRVDEMLNDSIVGFCLRYAQVKTDPNPHRIHLFSSFFYDALSRKIPRGAKINYDSVARWTKGKGLLESSDYVIIPINLNAHWFGLLIANVQNIPRSSEGESSTSQSTSKQQTKPRHAEKSPTDPVIMVLDSLNDGPTSNSDPVVRTIRTYLEREASEKLGLKIQPPPVCPGGSIPQQNNMIDCGLYLIAYLAKFMEDPPGFVTKYMTKSFTAEDWQNLNCKTMRRNIRHIILREYALSIGKTVEEHPAEGNGPYKEFTRNDPKEEKTPGSEREEGGKRQLANDEKEAPQPAKEEEREVVRPAKEDKEEAASQSDSAQYPAPYPLYPGSSRRQYPQLPEIRGIKRRDPPNSAVPEPRRPRKKLRDNLTIEDTPKTISNTTSTISDPSHQNNGPAAPPASPPASPPNRLKRKEGGGEKEAEVQVPASDHEHEASPARKKRRKSEDGRRNGYEVARPVTRGK